MGHVVTVMKDSDHNEGELTEKRHGPGGEPFPRASIRLGQVRERVTR